MSIAARTIIDIQPQIANEIVALRPLQPDDFPALYQIASDPLLWEQHPSKNRYQREVFEAFFADAIASGGALLITQTDSGQAIGTSRFYDVDAEQSSVAIGFTFLARDYWGTPHNKAVKSLMLDHAFRFVERVIFHIGADNMRSRKAIEKLGAILVKHYEPDGSEAQSNPHCLYQIEKDTWAKIP